MRCHLRKWYLRKERFFPFLIKVRPSLRDSAFSLRFPVENFRMVKFSTGKPLRKRRDGRKRIQKAKTATDVVHVRQGKRKRIVQEPLFMSGYGMKRGSGCGEGSPAPSALHVRVVLPISTSAGIACPFLRRNGLPQQAAWHRLFRIWRNIPEKRVEDGLLFGCITTKLYFCKK